LVAALAQQPASVHASVLTILTDEKLAGGDIASLAALVENNEIRISLLLCAARQH
jgi:hypothetical protein